jgi:hypothetical protein
MILVAIRGLPDSAVAVESERKNPFTIIGFSVGKLLWAESVSPKGRINSHVKVRFRGAQSYALDSAFAVLRSVFRSIFEDLTLSASSCGEEVYDYD